MQSKQRNDVFVKLADLSSDLWNERKGLDWTNKPNERKRIIKNLEKTISQIKDLKFDEEIMMLKHFYNIN